MSKFLYEQIAKDLREKIQSGYYPVNEYIPREIDLTVEYNVSRPTIQKAIEQLVNEGLLSRKKKVGTKVISKKLASNFTNMIESYNEDIRKHQVFPRTQVINFEELEADFDVAAALSIEIGDKVYKLVRLRFAGTNPMVYVTTYLPKDRVPSLIDYDFTVESLYHVLTTLDLPVKKVVRYLEVDKANEFINSILSIPVGDPYFDFKTIGSDQDGVPIEYSIAHYRGDLNSFKFVIEQ